MCGIAGFWGINHCDPAIAQRMGLQIQSRGPDDSGVWVDEAAGLALAHRRLSIIDLSPAGHQPMHSPCGRFTLVFNGEIYNHEDLRHELETVGGAFDWRGHSDTETLLAGLRHWGMDTCLQHLNGMFAFALWDRLERSLFLARDRMGEKPLYYGRSGKSFLFGSELKALTAHPDWRGEINRDVLALYMRHNYVPAPWSIYKGIRKLPPAHYVTVQDGGNTISEPVCYWDLPSIAARAGNPSTGDVESLTDQLDDLLHDAVGRRMRADVPLGAFLSGGIDSTMVVAQMQAQSTRAVKTFSIGFHETDHNEAHHAGAVAAYLGTDHTEHYVTHEEAMSVIPRLPEIYDEPFADSSQIPTFLVSQLARRQVTVSLSGDGGDELFCGYTRYALGYTIWRKLRLLPRVFRLAAALGLRHAPAHVLENLQQLFPQRIRVSYLSDRLPKLAEMLPHKDSTSFYRDLISHWKQPTHVVLGAKEPSTLLDQPGQLPDLPDFRDRMMLLDMLTYLPGDILTKIDRASMAVSLETRVPLLDHRLVEFAWSVPIAYKAHNGQGKWLLRRVLDRYVPHTMVDRPKMGFRVPIEFWLRGPLREWAEELLNDKRLREEGFLDPKPIRNLWYEHASGRRRWHPHLWNVLMFQAWLKTQVGVF